MSQPRLSLEQDDCCICLVKMESLTTGNKKKQADKVYLPCAHAYHRGCIVKHLRKNRRDPFCPICRRKVGEQDILNISPLERCYVQSAASEVLEANPDRRITRAMFQSEEPY